MMTRKEDQMIMAKNNGETVILKDLWSLLPGQWVSDAVVHYVVKAMVDPVGITDEGVAFFTSFFITKLFQEGMAENEGGGAFLYHGVKKWKKILKRPINEMDTLIFFRNQSNMHWLVYVIFIGQKTIQEFDSLSGGQGDKEVLKGLYKWLEIEMKEVGIILEESEWNLYPPDIENTPQQNNGNDCGIFMLLFAVCIAQGLPLNLVTNDRVATARRLLIHHFLQKEKEFGDTGLL